MFLSQKKEPNFIWVSAHHYALGLLLLIIFEQCYQIMIKLKAVAKGIENFHFILLTCPNCSV